MKRKHHAIARSLRKRSTDTERLLWRPLRARRLGGFKFRRQEPVCGYVADFLCYETTLVVELDGGQHATTKGRAEDEVRDQVLEEAGFRVLRFWNNEVQDHLPAVLDIIHETCIQRASTQEQQRR